MKTTTIVAALMACAGLAAAAPVSGSVADAHMVQVRDNGKASKPKECKKKKNPFFFTSTFQVKAVPEEVIGSNNMPAPGQPGAVGYYNFGLNAPLNTICYNITFVGVEGEYQSPANTATHIHQAVRGRAGPPRIAFPNPVADPSDAKIRRTAGCLSGPFVTGIMANGTDTGAGFNVRQIEENPEQFFADVHTNLFVPGAIRGQLA